MDSAQLTSEELAQLIKRVFPRRRGDKTLGLLVDLPDSYVPDTPLWKARRAMAADWKKKLMAARQRTGLHVNLIFYFNVHQNNADLPPLAYLHRNDTPVPDSMSGLYETARPLPSLMREQDILIALTQFSATAPLKIFAKAHGIRAATMPGFTAEMIPALRLNYTKVNNRVMKIKELLDRAESAIFSFLVGEEEYRLVLDLRHRQGHASGGIFPDPGVAGNLPSGEAYIVPYEGEQPGVTSRSAGMLPVQFGQEVVVYEVSQNKAVRVLGQGEAAVAEAAKLNKEPAYANLAELGLGVLGDLGVEPAGVLLLDEKLGPHIAFGRSDHFGGQVGPEDFSSPAAVVHIDRVYVPSMQPLIKVSALDLVMDNGATLPLMRDDAYVIEW